jgi:hypothetical protein
MGSKTPAGGCSKESWPIDDHGEAEGGRIVEGWRGGMSWC